MKCTPMPESLGHRTGTRKKAESGTPDPNPWSHSHELGVPGSYLTLPGYHLSSYKEGTLILAFLGILISNNE